MTDPLQEKIRERIVKAKFARYTPIRIRHKKIRLEKEAMLNNSKDFRHQDFRRDIQRDSFWEGVKTTLFFLFLGLTGAFFLGILKALIS